MVTSSLAMELGVEGFAALPELRERAHEFTQALHTMHRGVFLRSESTKVELGVPQELSSGLAETSALLVRRFDAFANRLIDRYFEHSEGRAQYLKNPIFDALLSAERRGSSHLGCHRLDCVLRKDGRLLVIENNAVGICAYHYRNLLYLVRGLWRAGLTEAAERVEAMTKALSSGFRRYYEERAANPKERPTLGMLIVRGHMRAGRIVFRDAFQRHGWDFVCGTPDELQARPGGLFLCGKKVDLLWSDMHFYLGYQATRYSADRFPSKIARFDHVADEVKGILADSNFLDLIRNGEVVNLSSSRAYLGLAKPLLSRVHHGEELVDRSELDWLREHVARSYSLVERQSGVITLEEAIARREELVAKPALYGGSVGVLLGTSSSTDEWTRKLSEIWDDPTWVLQHFEEPARTSADEWLSVGLMGLSGEFGGAILRTSSELTVSAREAKFLPALVAI